MLVVSDYTETPDREVSRLHKPLSCRWLPSLDPSLQAQKAVEVALGWKFLGLMLRWDETSHDQTDKETIQCKETSTRRLATDVMTLHKYWTPSHSYNVDGYRKIWKNISMALQN